MAWFILNPINHPFPLPRYNNRVPQLFDYGAINNGEMRCGSVLFFRDSNCDEKGESGVVMGVFILVPISTFWIDSSSRVLVTELLFDWVLFSFADGSTRFERASNPIT